MLRTEMEQLFEVGELAQGVTGILMNISLKIAAGNSYHVHFNSKSTRNVLL
jgi:hypothetical protein